MSSQNTAIELLKLGDKGRNKPFLNKYWGEIVGVTLGIGLGCFINVQTKRPVFSGLQKHVIFAGTLGYVLKYCYEKREAYLAEKDAVYRHYIELHPEDFPIPERKKIGEILEPWIPVR